MTLSDIGIKSPHRSLDLKALRINYDNAYNQLLELMDNGQQAASVDPFGNDDSMASDHDQPHGAKPHLGDEDFMKEFLQPDDVFGTNDLVDDDDQILQRTNCKTKNC